MTAFPVSFIYHGMKVPAAFPYLDILIHGKPDSDSACRKQPKCRAILFAPFDALESFDEIISEVADSCRSGISPEQRPPVPQSDAFPDDPDDRIPY